jgi:hypothetical protein
MRNSRIPIRRPVQRYAYADGDKGVSVGIRAAAWSSHGGYRCAVCAAPPWHSAPCRVITDLAPPCGPTRNNARR